MESSDLSIRLNIEPMAPVSATPPVQGQSPSGEGEGKPRRRPPAPEQAAESELDDEDRLEHRVDSLA
jgi:hypothetical protein